jgi:hypothetical protein
MDQSSGASQVSSTTITASTLGSFQVQVPAAPPALVATRNRHPEYTVADVFGRCFLRVCFWVDVFSSMARRGEPLPYVPVPRSTATRTRTIAAAGSLSAEPAQASSASASGKTAA